MRPGFFGSFGLIAVRCPDERCMDSGRAVVSGKRTSDDRPALTAKGLKDAKQRAADEGRAHDATYEGPDSDSCSETPKNPEKCMHPRWVTVYRAGCGGDVEVCADCDEYKVNFQREVDQCASCARAARARETWLTCEPLCHVHPGPIKPTAPSAETLDRTAFLYGYNAACKKHGVPYDCASAEDAFKEACPPPAVSEAKSDAEPIEAEWERQYIWAIDKLRWALGVVRTWDMLNPPAGAPEPLGDGPFFREMIDEVLSKTVPKYEQRPDSPLTDRAARWLDSNFGDRWDPNVFDSLVELLQRTEQIKASDKATPMPPLPLAMSRERLLSWLDEDPDHNPRAIAALEAYEADLREHVRKECSSTAVPDELLLAAGDLGIAAVYWVEAREEERKMRGRAPASVRQKRRDCEARLIMAVRKFAFIKPVEDRELHEARERLSRIDPSLVELADKIVSGLADVAVSAHEDGVTLTDKKDSE